MQNNGGMTMQNNGGMMMQNGGVMGGRMMPGGVQEQQQQQQHQHQHQGPDASRMMMPQLQMSAQAAGNDGGRCEKESAMFGMIFK